MFISKQKCKFSKGIRAREGQDSNRSRASVDGKVAQQAVSFGNFIYTCRYTAFF